MAHEKQVAFAAKVSGVYKITLGFDDGRFYVSIPSKKTFPGGVGIKEKYDPRSRPWYKLGKKVNGFALSDVFVTKQGSLLLGAVQSIKNGILLADIRLNNLHELLEGVNVISGATSYIVDAKGMVLASTDKNIKIQQQIQTHPYFSSLSSTLLNASTSYNEQTVEGVSQLIFSNKINLIGGSHWFLINVVDRDIALNKVDRITIEQYCWALGIAIVFILIIIVVLNQVYKPVIALKHLILNLSQGSGDLSQTL